MIHQWISGTLGLVVVGLVFLNVSEAIQMWSLVTVGLIIAASSFWGIVSEGESFHSSGIKTHA